MPEDEINPWDCEVKPMLNETERRWRSGDRSWVSSTEFAYDHFLECVPPAAYAKGGFATGEAFDFDELGVDVYLCFRCLNGKYEARYATIREFKEGT